MSKLLQYLLNRGDYIAIENGKLVINPASGHPVPPEWLADHQQNLILEIIRQSGKDAYKFTKHSTGAYGKHKADGVTLFFTNHLTGEQAYVVFNVHRDKVIGTGKLGKNKFRVTEQMALYRLYLKVVQQVPLRRRLTEGHRLLRHFKELVITFNSVNGLVVKGTIETFNHIPNLEDTHKKHGKKVVETWQNTGKNVVKKSGNVFPDRPDTATVTDKSNYVSSELRNKLISKDVISNSFTSLNSSLIDSNSSNEFHTKKRPEDQTVDEWLVDYDEAQRNNNN